MRRCIGLLIGACFLVGLTPLASVAQAPAAGSPVQIVKVYPDKLRYLRGEKGTVRVTLRNTSQTDQTVTLEGEIAQELALVTPLPRREVTVPGTKELTIDLPITAPQREYGCAVRVRAQQGGKVIAQAQDMFNVADDVWNVAIGANLTIMDMSGRPWQDLPRDIKTARERYFNWWEKMFWPPDDWGEMTPEADSWFSGQGGRYEIKKVIKEFTVLARANGIASVSYGKCTGGGPAGWEIARRRPDWFKQDDFGRMVGTYDTDLFAKWDSLPKFDGRPWYYLYPNMARLDALDHGIDEILNSALEYGWDGVRFDGDFTWVGSDEVAARNQRRMKERIWAKLPYFVFGYNEGFGPPDTDPATWSHGLREGLAGGGHWMNEGIGNCDFGYASNARYTSFRDYWEREGAKTDRLRQIGASYHFIYYLPKESRGLYKFVLGTSAGTHPVYGESAAAPGCANWGRYLTRWSAFVWDVNLRNRPDADAEITSRVPLWHAVKDRVADDRTSTTVVHLIVPPSTDDCHDAKVELGPPAEQVAVRARIPAGETVVRAAAIAPERPDDARELPVTREGEWAIVTVPEVKVWTMVVFERAGKYAVPTYPRFSEPPDPAAVAAGELVGVPKLSRDPLRPEAASETGAKVRVVEGENAYFSQGVPEADPNASNGACLRADSTMSNSTILSHAFFSSVTPGHYRATYRMKLKSRTDDAGKPVWAGFGLYVMLGTKQIWPREVGSRDFTTTGKYEDFAIEFDFLGEGTRIQPAAFWRGQDAGGTIYVDKVSLEQLSTFTDADIFDKLKAGAASDYLAIQGIAPGGQPGIHVLVVNGLYNDLYRIPEALQLLGPVREITDAPAKDGKTPAAPGEPELLEEPAAAPPPVAAEVRYVPVSVEEGGVATLTGYPQTYADLYKYDVVVLINADAWWPQFAGRAQLREFVNAGGGLLVLGGNFTLGQGAFAGTFLADMLPVTVAQGKDALPAEKPLQLKPAATGLARALPGEVWKTGAKWGAPAYLYWRHRVAAKPEAQAHLLAGDEPVLFTGSYGKGRVAVFTGTVLGEAQDDTPPFWRWAGWPLLMRSTLAWLAPGAAEK